MEKINMAIFFHFADGIKICDKIFAVKNKKTNNNPAKIKTQTTPLHISLKLLNSTGYFISLQKFFVIIKLLYKISAKILFMSLFIF